jgi:hypothetical protein
MHYHALPVCGPFCCTVVSGTCIEVYPLTQHVTRLLMSENAWFVLYETCIVCWSRFERAHGDHAMTTMALDAPHRRLLTGSDNGVLKVWNFSSGDCLKEMISLCTKDITGVLQLGCELVPGTFVLPLGGELSGQPQEPCKTDLYDLHTACA